MTLDEIVAAIGLEPFYTSPQGVIYCADCLDVLPRIPDGAVDLVLTDPPYGVNVAEWDKQIPCALVLHECLRIASTVVWFGAAPPLSVKRLFSH